MQPGLDLDLLRTFVEVAETRSFTGAGERLGRVQSAVSMQIRRLEDITDSRLFSRTPQKVELTAEGEQLLTFARRILSLSDEALASLREDAPKGRIRFGTSDVASAFLPKILARFTATNPRVELEVICDRSWKLLSALDRGRLDIALVTQSRGRSGGKLLLREAMRWVTSPAHLAHLQEPLPLALYAKGCIYRDVSAGLAVGIMSKSMISDGLAILDDEADLPPLPSFELSLHFGDSVQAASTRHFADTLALDLQTAR